MRRQPHWTFHLRHLFACKTGRRWARQFPDAQAAWNACERGDWMAYMIQQAARTGHVPPADYSGLRYRNIVCWYLSIVYLLLLFKWKWFSRHYHDVPAPGCAWFLKRSADEQRRIYPVVTIENLIEPERGYIIGALVPFIERNDPIW